LGYGIIGNIKQEDGFLLVMCKFNLTN
jgi:hypothetical protein